MTQEANGSYFGPKHLKQTILSYSQFIENGQAKLGQHYSGQCWGVYAKTAGKTEMWGRVKMNKPSVRNWHGSLNMFSNPTVSTFSSPWSGMVVMVHAYNSCQCIGTGNRDFVCVRKEGLSVSTPCQAPTGAIFFFEVLAVCHVAHIAEWFADATQLLIVMDNMNTFEVITSLNAQPVYNPVLISAVDAILNLHLDLWVVYIPGQQNFIVDTVLIQKWFCQDACS